MALVEGSVLVAVLLEDLNVIVRVSTLESKYPGGVLQYQRDFLSGSFCCDGLLTRVGSGARSDIEAVLAGLRGAGLVVATEHGFEDLAIVDEFRGFPDVCDWLYTGRLVGGISYAYLPGTDPNALLAVPTKWSQSAREPGQRTGGDGEPRPQLLFLRRDGKDDVFLDRQTGRELRVPTEPKGDSERMIN